MKYSVEMIQKQYAQGTEQEYLFFWGHKPLKYGNVGKNCLSQWFECRFTVENIQYHTAEQYMMSQKALVFGDNEIYEKIMQSADPAVYKALGRKIKNFDENIWNTKKTDIVIKGNTAKFSQNQNLKEFLLSTNEKILVEASPYDRIWGIGMSANTENIQNPYIWKGKNLLGFCLMETRDILRSEIT